jgi:hypothetical protein
MYRRDCSLLFLLTRSSLKYHSSSPLHSSRVNRVDYRLLDSDLAMHDLRGHHWPPQHTNSCTVPKTSQHTGNMTIDILNSCTYHTKVQPTLLADIARVFGLRGVLRNLGTYSGFSKAALMLRRLRRADTERMVVMSVKLKLEDMFDLGIRQIM